MAGLLLSNRSLKSLPPGVLNSDQLEEGTNQDLLTKEMGGVVYFNLTEDQEPVSLYGFDDSHKELYPWSTRWIPEEERYFLIKCSQFH